MKRQGKRLLSMMAAMIVVLTTILAPSSVAATEKVDVSKSGSASLVLELPAASDSVKLYQIAEYDGDSKIVMKKEAADLKVAIDGKESEAALSQKAQTLAGKLKTVAATGKTDAKLNVKFDKLKLGYYLVTVDKCESDSKKYEVTPVIVSVPAAQKSTWNYNVAVKLKGQEVKATPVPATTTPKAPTGTEKGETVGADDDSSADSEITPPSPTPTEEPTATPIPTETPSPSPTETEEPSPTPTEEPTATPIPTETEEPSPTATEEPTATPIPTETPGLTPTVTATPSVTEEPTESGTPTPSVTDEPSESETPTPSVTEEPTPSVSGGPTDSITPTPGTESDDSNPDFPPDDSSIPDITVTPDPNMWQMSVTKYWIDKNNLPLSDKDETIPDSLSIQIWKKASEEAKWEKVELVELTAENKWEYSWMAPDDGATWTVTEDVVPIGFTQLTIKQSKNAAKKTLAFRVTNMSNADVTPAPIQLSVVKYWKDKNGNDLDDKEISVKSLPIQIYRREKDATAWKLYKTVELTADSAWEYHWGAADDGASWTVTERDVPEGYALQSPIRLAHNAANTKMEFRVTNVSDNGGDTPTVKPPTNTPTPTSAPIQLSVVKYWKDKNGNDIDANKIGVKSLTIQIYRKEKGANDWKLYKTVKLTADTAWEYHWGAADDGASWTVVEKDVPSGYVLQTPIRFAHNANNTKLEFRVTNVKGPTPTPTKKPTKTPTPTPTKKPISFSVVKKWQSASGGTLSSTQTGVSSLTVDIYRKYPGATSYTKVDSIELLPSNNWTHSWTAPDDGSTWTVTEPRTPDGYTKVGITQAKNDSAHTRVFTITNKKTSTRNTPTPTGTSRRVTATITSKATGSSRTSPNTGDNQNIWIPIMTMLGASVVLVVLVRKRVR